MSVLTFHLSVHSAQGTSKLGELLAHSSASFSCSLFEAQCSSTAFLLPACLRARGLHLPLQRAAAQRSASVSGLSKAVGYLKYCKHEGLQARGSSLHQQMLSLTIPDFISTSKFVWPGLKKASRLSPALATNQPGYGQNGKSPSWDYDADVVPEVLANATYPEGQYSDSSQSPVVSVRQTARSPGFKPPGPSSLVEDENHDLLLDEARELYREGKEALEGRLEFGVAEEMLYEAVRVLERASELNPASVTAVGLCGNVLLSHGELKLKLARQLRGSIPPLAEVPRGNRRSMPRGGSRGDQGGWLGGWWQPDEGEEEDEVERYEMLQAERRQIMNSVYEVADECEQLLIEAGRKFRAALTMDASDVKALFNWGLALSCRGHLITDEAEEGYVETADKMFLAAIDKYEAMMGLGHQFRAAGLLNWGLVLRDRARLRDMGDPNRLRLMEQGQELMNESLSLQPNNRQARAGVRGFEVEIQTLVNYLGEFRERSNERLPGRQQREPYPMDDPRFW
eukprot:TRINITY_DN562_c2_g1_i1.p1 TRINITY_DN562_c2_g1~~TRINITY_DN562_c2_g1_i1.p1  ORF type:complete len:511 (+),score=46.71 TRINITY_DN562_c2_g1_i1:241-1773(+)